MVELLERWGNLPEGSTELLKSDTLQNATRAHLEKFAEDLASEVASGLRETNLDLDKLRWPVVVTIRDQYKSQIAFDVSAVIDRMGRYFFRVQDVEEGWFVPGYTLIREGKRDTRGAVRIEYETILESTTLFSGEQAVAIQVSTSKDA